MPTITTIFAPDQAVRIKLPTLDGESFVRGRIESVVVKRDPETGEPVTAEAYVKWSTATGGHAMPVNPFDLTPVGSDDEHTFDVPFTVGDWATVMVPAKDADETEGGSRLAAMLSALVDEDEVDEVPVAARVTAVLLGLDSDGSVVPHGYHVEYSRDQGISRLGVEPDELTTLGTNGGSA